MVRSSNEGGRRETAESILDAAERLFGKHGVEGVSLRQIGLAAGSANTVAVQYHFGTKEELIRAIFARRLPQFEMERSAGLRDAQASGLGKDARTLLDVLLRPLSNATDAEGHFTYAAFLLSLRHISGDMAERRKAEDLSPLTSYLMQLLEDTIPHVPPPLRRPRISEAGLVFGSMLLDWERRQAAGDPTVLPRSAIISEAMSVALGAFSAPCSQETLSAIEAQVAAH